MESRKRCKRRASRIPLPNGERLWQLHLGDYFCGNTPRLDNTGMLLFPLTIDTVPSHATDIDSENLFQPSNRTKQFETRANLTVKMNYLAFNRSVEFEDFIDGKLSHLQRHIGLNKWIESLTMAGDSSPGGKFNKFKGLNNKNGSATAIFRGKSLIFSFRNLRCQKMKDGTTYPSLDISPFASVRARVCIAHTFEIGKGVKRRRP